jgi:hypothetical protein
LRDQRKALDLELLGSDAGLEGEISENDAHRGNEEEKWAPKLMVRIEKMSSAKFLEFCNEQTTVVNNIWVRDLIITKIILIWKLIFARDALPIYVEPSIKSSIEIWRKMLQQQVTTTLLHMPTLNNLRLRIPKANHLRRKNFNTSLTMQNWRLSNSNRRYSISSHKRTFRALSK